MKAKDRHKWLALALGALICAVLIGTGFAGYSGYQAYQLKCRPLVAHITRDFLKPNTRLDVVVLTANRFPELHGTRVISPYHVFLLRSPDQLQDLVTITTAKQALHFVRLRTTLCNTSRRDEAHEIVMHSRLHDSENFDVEHQSHYDTFRSGMYGVLSETAYHQGKFTPTTVDPVSGRFVITRWVWIDSNESPGSRLEQWRETVTPSGAYAQITLKAEPIPNLPIRSLACTCSCKRTRQTECVK